MVEQTVPHFDAHLAATLCYDGVDLESNRQIGLDPVQGPQQRTFAGGRIDDAQPFARWKDRWHDRPNLLP
jgi:hypothetical protein